ncbi:MAG TPA: hypothetical protein VK430_11635 [Xanthobacteraceae bacterium]|nr:hypothetical protein [Xanthobacteraceae bacterium]
MSLTNDATRNAGDTGRRQADNGLTNSHFRFVPRELALKCRTLIESYHAMHGYGCLPDMLWHSDARDMIECHRDLTKIFKNAAKSRCAKRANESFLTIATIVVSLEALARDFAGWGKRFPAAKREAEELLGDHAPRPRIWFMDMYLYPPLGIHRQFASTLAPSAAAEPVTTRIE